MKAIHKESLMGSRLPLNCSRRFWSHMKPTIHSIWRTY